MLRVENLTKLYSAGGGGVRDISFDVSEGEFYTLLGPSGCGKTTTLRSVAGLEEPTAGRMTIEGKTIFDSSNGTFVPSNRRRLGMVFQSYAVWPHMSVYENTAFPLRMLRDRRWNSADMRKRVTRALETVGLDAFVDRPASQLSGGQQQRLALARALVGEPRLLLLDEPLSNLDALLREQMRSELRRLQKEVGVTAIYVTHDQSEALALSDRIAIMNAGRITQIGTPQAIYHQPSNAFVATFIGRSNLLRGELSSGSSSGDGIRMVTALGPILCAASQTAPSQKECAALVRPEHVMLSASAPGGTDGVNRFRGRIQQASFLGEIVEYVVQVGPVEILIRTIGNYQGGEEVDVTLPPERTLAINT